MTGERNSRYWIERLQLIPHPEGGFYRQTYCSKVNIAADALPSGFGRARAASTAIYFLLEGENFSAFHRLRSDELWHFYAGSPLVVHRIDSAGEYSRLLMGSEPERDESFQAVVPAGDWFASHVADRKSWSLVGCTVAPGFDFADFELAKRDELVSRYPRHRVIIDRLTRE